MLITGILITIVALFMVLVPQFFVKLKSPRIPDGLLKNPKMKIVLRIWGVIFIMVGLFSRWLDNVLTEYKVRG